MRHPKPVATVVLSAIFGGLIGAVLWFAVNVALVFVQLQGMDSPDTPPSPLVHLREDTVLLFMVGGTLAGAYCGWRLSQRRRREALADQS